MCQGVAARRAAPVVEALPLTLFVPDLITMLMMAPPTLPVSRRVVVGFDADLFERVRARLIRHQVVDRVVHVDAVEREVVRLLALAVDIRPAAAGVLRGS